MIGWMILGGLAALGISRCLRMRRHRGWGCAWRHHGMRRHAYSGCGSGGGGWEEDDWERGGGRRRVPFVVSMLSERLGATPTQERAINAAVEEFRADIETLRGELPRTRADLAAALRKPAFDEVLLGELFARHDGVLEKGRKALVGLVARLHDALDERQRERLAALLERGHFMPGGHGW